MDKASKTLTVQKIYDDSLNWQKTETCSRKATLPTGSIQVGNVVTNCEGNLSLRHIPTNVLFGAYDFK